MLQYPAAIYHIMNRGDGCGPIFREDAERQRFLDALGEASSKSGWQIHARRLLGNHFHLVLGTPQPNLVTGMKWFLDDEFYRLTSVTLCNVPHRIGAAFTFLANSPLVSQIVFKTNGTTRM